MGCTAEHTGGRPRVCLLELRLGAQLQGGSCGWETGSAEAAGVRRWAWGSECQPSPACPPPLCLSFLPPQGSQQVVCASNCADHSEDPVRLWVQSSARGRQVLGKGEQRQR